MGLRRKGLGVRLLTISRILLLLSLIGITKEFRQLAEAFGWGLDDFEWMTLNAMKSAFAPFPERLRIINGMIKPRYALLRAELAMGTQTR